MTAQTHHSPDLHYRIVFGYMVASHVWYWFYTSDIFSDSYCSNNLFLCFRPMIDDPSIPENIYNPKKIIKKEINPIKLRAIGMRTERSWVQLGLNLYIYGKKASAICMQQTKLLFLVNKAIFIAHEYNNNVMERVFSSFSTLFLVIFSVYIFLMHTILDSTYDLIVQSCSFKI